MAMRFMSATLTLALLVPAAATAQVDTSDWKCELCPFESGYEADYEVGALYVSDDAARFGNANGLDEKGAYAALDGEGRVARDGYRTLWTVEDLALDSRKVALETAVQGTFGVYLGYDELPYRLFDTTRTIFTATSNDFLALPPGWVTAPSTAGFTELDASLMPVAIGSDRSRITAGGHWLASGFKLFADYRREEQDGVRISSGSTFTQSSMLPRLIDYQTDIIDLGVRYSKGPLSLSLAWYGSFFDNNAASLTWENPFFDNPAIPGFDPLRMALEPSNDYQQFTLSGSYRFEVMDTVLAVMLASGQGDQNEPLLAYTINPTLTPGALPRATADASVDTTNYSVTLTTRPLDQGRLSAWYRFDERDNSTPQDMWSRVITDTFLSNDPGMNTPYSFERARFGIRGEYEFFDRLRVSAGYERTDLDRDFQEVAEQTEDDGWGRARLRISDWLDFSLKAGAARREIDRYDETVAAGFGQNPLLRKYNLAYRYREYGEVMVGIAPVDWPVSATVTALFADDSFTQSQLGMTEANTSHYSIDFGWTLSENASLYAVFGGENIDADQLGSAAFAAADWAAAHRDKFSHYGGGLVVRSISDSMDLSFDYTHTDGETGIRVDQAGQPSSVFPTIDSDLDALRATLTYRRSDRLDIDFSLRYEQFQTNDWALAGVEPDTMSNVLSMGANPWDYDVWVVGIGFRYLVGPREISFPE
jgi:MtrB/PioB family decaheme-associated outer membrane protein